MKKKRAETLAVENIQVRVSMLNENGFVEGRKKPNSETLESETNSALALDTTGEEVSGTEYLTVAVENKQGVSIC
ncbi:hypothetical protein ID858_17260 [Xenorhabdus sp. DI]|uniref:hypothetical protein n=1 Tax=Xenorhabdus doucetiae TaxID=351671 RepID=UPI0019BAC901|nr:MULTISPECIES: hypothetical protein [unclassified Xenorhabdus]MBD2786432.1 hypothetical protein [Xenorhabdus sp. 3]MBD2790242.1 hypothetical protein [Xenorhabdus sp. DI]